MQVSKIISSQSKALSYALGVIALLATPTLWAAESYENLELQDCVRIALSESAAMDQAEAQLNHYKGVLAEVEAMFYPQLQGMAYLAPMFTVTGDINSFERKWQSPSDWGPYAHFEAVLAQPIYTFGRLEAGEKAATERLLVEKARVREARNLVALEIKRLYNLYLYAKSIQPALKSAKKTVDKAIVFAQEEFEAGTGEVNQVDLAKLDYAAVEVERYLREAKDGSILALAALRHTMGIADGQTITIKAKRIKLPNASELPELTELIIQASKGRPEMIQLAHGRKAAKALVESESKANLPVLFWAGQASGDWTPTRDDHDNPYVFDEYNQFFGGLAIGLAFNIAPATANAKTKLAEAQAEEVEALGKLAATGIPLQVRKAHQEVKRFQDMAKLGKRAVVSTRKWMIFAASAYTTGTGEASDLLEGLGAMVSAKEKYYATLRDLHVAHAELDFAIGAEPVIQPVVKAVATEE